MTVRKHEHQIPVIDIFAGPGGLGEGFASFVSAGKLPFKITLSIEKEQVPHQTLMLRAFFRQFQKDSIPADYYEHLRGNISRQTLFSLHPKEAKQAANEAWHQELRRKYHPRVRRRIKAKVGKEQTWVLIGGPPCQAYSLAGRSRLSGLRQSSKKTKRDHRHYLYREYLRILADHSPPIFVMENVKGLLSSTTGKKGTRIFKKIFRDLQKPQQAIYGRPKRTFKVAEYKIFPLANRASSPFEPADYVIRMEEFGVPQTRHRVILLGIRSDLDITPKKLTRFRKEIAIKEVIGDLPKLRSTLSKGRDSNDKWAAALTSLGERKWLSKLRGQAGVKIRQRLSAALVTIGTHKLKSGGEFVRCKVKVERHRNWFYDKHLGGFCNHSSRSHIRKDLQRYLFLSVFAKINKRSPTLKELPRPLLPKHKNVNKARAQALFSDRFRVQVATRPASTITSHISKDGHYFIHPDQTQCRSLTVREAARIQTFPDNYFFAGPRTDQYQQVGNAVPPYLARQIARIVYDLVKQLQKST